jgi:hypothetical protein
MTAATKPVSEAIVETVVMRMMGGTSGFVSPRK